MTTVAEAPQSAPEANEANEANAPTRNRPIWQLVVGMAAFLAVLGVLGGGWPLPVVVVSILLMVVLHELGHFSTAKWTGMRVTEFFAGFGPRLWSKQIGETEYGIKLYPVGGYVKIPGMTMAEELHPTEESRSYRQATFPRRVLVVSAGSIVHFMLALILAYASIMFIGQAVGSKEKIGSFGNWSGQTTPARAAGLQKGDVVTAINGRPIASQDAFVNKIQHSVGQALTLSVVRNGHTITVSATPVDGRHVYLVGSTTPLAPANGPAQGYLGIEFQSQQVTRSIGPLAAIPAAFATVWHATTAIFSSTLHLFSPAGVSGIAHNVTHPSQSSQPQNLQNRPLSILGIVQLLLGAAKAHPASLLALFMVVNISFGLINMLPMLPLDGGHVAIACYERIRTRKGRPAYHADVNKLMPVVYAFVSVLLLLFVSSLYLDIAHPVSF